MENLEQNDRRNSVRLNFVADVIVSRAEGNTPVQGELVNLGIGGLAIRTTATIEIGASCNIEIIIPDRYSQLVIRDLEGEVIRCANGEIAFKFRHRFEWLALFHVYRTKSAEEKSI